MMPGFTAIEALDSRDTQGPPVRGLHAPRAHDAIVPALPRQHHAKVRQDCLDAGGLYWSEGKTGFTYGCIRPDGHGIVCGGRTKAQENSCDVF